MKYYTDEHPLFGVWNTLKKTDIGISLSVGFYIMMIGIGMLFSFCYYGMFNINIFKFSEISDFLLIPFADPFTIIFTLLSIIIIVGISYLDLVLRKKNPDFHLKFSRWATLGLMSEDYIKHKLYQKKNVWGYYFAIMIYVFYAAVFYGKYKATRVKNQQTYIEYKIDFEGNIPAKDSLIFLGDNAGYYFLYHSSQKESYVIPKDKLNFAKLKKNKNGSFF